MRKWTDEKIKHWNIENFGNDQEAQLKKVEEELLEVEKAKRGVFLSQAHSFNDFYQETADAYIAAVGLSNYEEYLALSRFLKNYLYSSIGIILDAFIDEKMEINIKRTFVKVNGTQHHVTKPHN